ncbi:MAG TPA: D-arabinono-1,4-lactone oxidase [Ohtaekwangia sp.]|nr:D-arabinono-1,4-lactone oxidase [Ohtaekwangia sp.]
MSSAATIKAATEWSNWSGSLKFTPWNFGKPGNEDALRQVIRNCYTEGRQVRLAAAGHSSTPLVETRGTLLHLHHFKGIIRRDDEQQTVTFGAGMTVHEANAALQEIGLALFNTGDVDVQTLAGAIATGTHGTGMKLRNLSSMLRGVRMVDYQGNVREFSSPADERWMNAMRVSLGALGIFTELTVRVVPLFKLTRTEHFTTVDSCLENFDALAGENRNVDFYWYPRSDEIKIRILNEPGQGTTEFPYSFRCVKHEEGWVGEILPRHRELRFDEMEYALPREAGIACFKEVRNRIKARHRKAVAWRVLYRTIAGDANYLSPHYGRDSVSISLHHNAGLPFDAFFNDIEPIFIHHSGRPHWAKKHNLKARQLRPLYPAWEAFQDVRRSLDPEGFFMNHYLKVLIGEYEE